MVDVETTSIVDVIPSVVNTDWDVRAMVDERAMAAEVADIAEVTEV